MFHFEKVNSSIDGISIHQIIRKNYYDLGKSEEFNQIHQLLFLILFFFFFFFWLLLFSFSG